MEWLKLRTNKKIYDFDQSTKNLRTKIKNIKKINGLKT